MSGHLRYRCRDCGEAFAGVHGEYEHMQIQFMRLLNEEILTDTGSFHLRRIEMHCHSDGTLGFSDLIGVAPDSKQSPPAQHPKQK